MITVSRIRSGSKHTTTKAILPIISKLSNDEDFQLGYVIYLSFLFFYFDF